MSVLDSPARLFTPGLNLQASNPFLCSGLAQGVVWIAVISTAPHSAAAQTVLVDTSTHYVVTTASHVIPLKEHTARISTQLGLGKSELARIFGVSRPTLYSWIRGETEPSGDNARKIKILGSLLAEMMNPDDLPLYAPFVESSLPGKDTSLLAQLHEPEWNSATLKPLIKETHNSSRERERRLSQTHTLSPARQDERLEDNLSRLEHG